MTIRGYLVTLITVCSVTAIASAVAAEGKSKKYVNFVLSVVVLLVLIAPLTKWDALPFDLPLPDSTTAEATGDAVFRVTETALKQEIAASFSLDPDTVTVTVRGHVGDTAAVEAVTVALRGDAVRHVGEIRAYLAREIRGNCEVTVYVGESA